MKETIVMCVGVCTTKVRVKQVDGVTTWYTFKFGFRTPNMNTKLKDYIKKICVKSIKEHIDSNSDYFGIQKGGHVTLTASIRTIECDTFLDE